LLTALADILFDKQDVNHGRMTAGEMSLGEARDELFRQRKRDERE
jgi:hypothetical protein